MKMRGELSRAGISQITTPLFTFEQDVAAYGSAGWSAIGVWLHKLERPNITEFWFPDAEIPHQRVASAAAQLQCASMRVSHVIGGALYTDPDPDRRAARVAHTLHAMEVAEALGSACLVVIPGRLNGNTPQRAAALTAEALTTVLERTETANVLLGIEPVRPQQVDFVNTVDQAMDIVEAVDHPRLGVFPDIFHMWQSGSGDRYADELARAAGRIVGVHLGDVVPGDPLRAIPGEGTLPVAKFVRAIEATGYTGTYDVEQDAGHERETDPIGVVQRCAEAMSRILADAGVAASP